MWKLFAYGKIFAPRKIKSGRKSGNKKKKEKKGEKNGPKEERKVPFCQEKKNNNL